MSQNPDRKKRSSSAGPSDTGTISSVVVIRLVIASIVFAVSLIVEMPDFIKTILLVLSAVAAGYDIVMKAFSAVEEGDFFATPVVVVLIAVIAFFIGFAVESAALLILYQIGLMLIDYAVEHTKKSALELIQYQDETVIQKMVDAFARPGANTIALESTLKTSSGAVLKLAMVIAVAYAVALPLFTNNSYSVSVHRAITIILIATPLSIVVSTPLSAMIGLCYSAQQGVAFDNAASMEALADCEIAIFDKAGIFADERPRVIAMHSDVLDANTFMNFVAHSVYYSEQPVAKAVAAVFDQEYRLGVIKDFREIPGYGVELSIDGIGVTFASRELFSGRGVELPPEEETPGQTFYMVVAGKYVGKLVISSEVNEDSENLVPSMKEVGISRCILLTEDSKESGQQLAELLGFSEMYPQCDTDAKLEKINEISKKAKCAVLFVYATGIEAHSAAAVDMRVSKKGKYADALVDPRSVNNIPFSKQVAARVREVCIENAVFAFVIKAVLIFLSIVGYCNLWFAMCIDMIAAVATVLNTIRVTTESFANSWRYKTGR